MPRLQVKARCPRPFAARVVARARSARRMETLTSARAQMEVSLGVHMIFAAAGIAMPILMLVAERLHLRTGHCRCRRGVRARVRNRLAAPVPDRESALPALRIRGGHVSHAGS